MLKIRPEQLKVFQPVAEAAFEQRVVEYLRENHDDEVVILPAGEYQVKDLDDGTLLKMVRTGIARARSYGMTWESNLTTFAIVMVVVAPNFDDHPLIRRVLNDDRIEPDQRIEQLWRLTEEENWKTAEDSYEARAWNLTS
jgi:hypothetical protein